MDRPKYKIMDALLLSQEGHEPVSTPENYVSSQEDIEFEKKNKAELQAVDKNIEKKKAAGKTEDVRTDQTPIQVGYNVPSQKKEDPEVAPELQPEQTPERPRNSLITPIDKVKDHVAPKSENEDSEESNLESGVNRGIDSMSKLTDEYPNFWVGAAPMLMGALLGDIGEGARAGSEGLIQRYKDERDANKELAKAQAKASDKKMQKFKYRGPDGTRLMGSYDPSTGDKYDASGQLNNGLEPDLTYEERRKVSTDESIRKHKTLGKHTTLKTNDLGQKVIYNQITGNSRLAFDPIGLPPRFEKSAERASDKFNKKAEPLIERMSSIREGFRNLSKKNQLANKLAIMSYVKLIETRLSDHDRNYYTNAVGLKDKIKEQTGQMKSGDINPRLLREARELALGAMQQYKKDYENIRGSHRSQLAGRKFPEESLDQVFGDIPDMDMRLKVYHPEHKFIDGKNKGKYKVKTISLEELKEHEKQGFIVRGAE